MRPVCRANTLLLVFSFMTLLFTAVSVNAGQDSMKHLYEGVPFDMPEVQLPKIPEKTFYLRDFGAKADGITDNSAAFAKAIKKIKRKGGGRLVISRGVWLSGPITLASNMELHLEHGALLKFIPDKALYPLIKTSYEGLDAWRPISPLYGVNLENIAITGSGVIDGSGGAWRYVKKSKLTSGQWKKLIASGGVVSDDGKMWFPSVESKQGALEQKQTDIFKYNKEQAEKIHHWLRPVMVALVDSDKVLLDGPTFQNSPAWNIHVLKSSNVVVRNLKVRNPWYSQNGDGLDMESVKNALVYNNTFDVGDDAICVKSGKNEDGRRRGIPTENVIIRNNMVYHAHGGFVVGSEMSGGVKNVFFSDATFIGTDIGIRFKSTRGRGGVVENIWISNVNMTDIVKNAISFNMFYSNNEPRMADRLNRKAQPAVDETTPQFKNIDIKNVRSINSGTAVILHGLPEMNLENVHISDSYFSAKKGVEAVDTAGLKISNIDLSTPAENAIVLLNAKAAHLSGIRLLDSQGVDVMGNKTENVHLDKALYSSKNLHIEDEVEKSQIMKIKK
ncbi:Polygalacturonase [Alteromonadaceae bacterium Bs31]|nr:Polygalacturonase [Alteromonadaceae bacterium Bs31]